MAILTPTIWSRMFTVACKHRIPYVPPTNSSITEVMDNPQAIVHQPTVITAGREVIDAFAPEADTSKLSSSYIVIGNEGHKTITGFRNVGIPAPVEHASTDAGLYWMIPFIIRPITSALSPTQRANYRLRKVHQIDGDFYEAYYAKKKPLLTQNIDLIVYQLINQNIVGQTPFIPTPQNLVPVQPVGDITNEQTHVAVNLPTPVTFSAQDITEIINACEILYGDSTVAFLSEIGICFGMDKPVLQQFPITGPQVPQNVPPNTYYECALLTVDTFICDPKSISESTTEVGISLTSGGSTPLYPTAQQSGTN